jgi:hypothetical protein
MSADWASVRCWPQQQFREGSYREIAESMIRVFETNLNEPHARQQALLLVALCVGAMVLARSVDDEILANDFPDAALQHIVAITHWGGGRGD